MADHDQRGKFAKGNKAATIFDKGPIEATKAELREAIKICFFSTKPEVKSLSESTTAIALHVALAKVMNGILSTGDTNKLEFMLNRMIGKVPDALVTSDKTGENILRLYKTVLGGLDTSKAQSQKSSSESSQESSGSQSPTDSTKPDSSS